MNSAAPTFQFPPKYSFDDDTSLKVFLATHQDESVTINAANLSRPDSLLFQYLIAAAKAWQQKSLVFQMVGVPQPIERALTLLGITEANLRWSLAQ